MLQCFHSFQENHVISYNISFIMSNVVAKIQPDYLFQENRVSPVMYICTVCGDSSFNTWPSDILVTVNWVIIVPGNGFSFICAKLSLGVGPTLNSLLGP